MAEPRVINYAGGQQIYNKEAVDSLMKVSVDSRLDASSKNPVENMAITKGIQAELLPIKNAIETLRRYLPDELQSEEMWSSIWTDTLRFASVKVGDIMYWPVSEPEMRSVRSDSPFEFTINGKAYSVTPSAKTIELIISKNVPEGWHVLDGKAELLASDYPALAEFMPENITTDGKIWLPYLRQCIIKITY